MEKKTKILQIGYGSLAKAGIQAVIMTIVRGLHTEMDFDVLLTSEKQGYYDKEFEKYGKIYRIKCDTDTYGLLRRYCSYALRPLRQFIYAYKLIRKNQYDIIHCHSGMEGGAMFLAAKAAGARVIIAHSHNTASFEKRSFFSKIYRWISKRIIHLTATKRIGASSEANAYLFGQDDCMVIDNPVDLKSFVEIKKTSICDHLEITHVGRYSYQKNQTFLLDISTELKKRQIPFHLNLVGFGDDENLLKITVLERGLETEVDFLPADSNIPLLMSKSDLFIFPSRFEGLGIALIEAQAAGVKCIASDVVPKETDVGLCKYVSLSSPVSIWVDECLSMYEDQSHYKLNFDLLGKFGVDTVVENYRRLYALKEEDSCEI